MTPHTDSSEVVRRRRAWRRLTGSEREMAYAALMRSTSPASAAAVAEVFGLDVSSVHRIRRTFVVDQRPFVVRRLSRLLH